MMQSPSPKDIRAARETAGLSQREAGELIHGSQVAWARYEGGRKMHPAFWELFLLKTRRDG